MPRDFAYSAREFKESRAAGYLRAARCGKITLFAGLLIHVYLCIIIK